MILDLVGGTNNLIFHLKITNDMITTKISNMCICGTSIIKTINIIK